MIRILLVIRDDTVRLDADLDNADNVEVSEAIAYLEKLKQELLKHLVWSDIGVKEAEIWQREN